MVVEAHAVLSDPLQRKRYDMGEDEDGMNGGGGGFGVMKFDANLSGPAMVDSEMGTLKLFWFMLDVASC